MRAANGTGRTIPPKEHGMPTRNAEARWTGDLLHGKGTMKLGSGAFEGTYSFGTRMQDQPGTNPEELIGAAHAGCFSMALTAGLGAAGFKPVHVATTAAVQFEKVGEGFKITRITLRTRAKVPGIDPAKFKEQAESAKRNCPVSQALSATPIELDAALE
jgi:lipoyl-dependent peroxiredoxin